MARLIFNTLQIYINESLPNNMLIFVNFQLILENLPKTINILPKWRNIEKSGHTAVGDLQEGKNFDSALILASFFLACWVMVFALDANSSVERVWSYSVGDTVAMITVLHEDFNIQIKSIKLLYTDYRMRAIV